MHSRRYYSLLHRHKNLEEIFLPERQSVWGRYTPSEIEKTAAFVVLMHAEFENFIEDIAKSCLSFSLNNWLKKRVISRPLLSLLAYREAGAVSQAINSQSAQNRVATLIHEAAAYHLKKIDNNQGIRQRNVAQLFIPLGFEDGELDETVISSLDSFGKDRGNLAHKGASNRSVQISDPFVISQEIRQLVSGLCSLDEVASTYRYPLR